MVRMLCLPWTASCASCGKCSTSAAARSEVPYWPRCQSGGALQGGAPAKALRGVPWGADACEDPDLFVFFLVHTPSSSAIWCQNVRPGV